MIGLLLGSRRCERRAYEMRDDGNRISAVSEAIGVGVSMRPRNFLAGAIAGLGVLLAVPSDSHACSCASASYAANRDELAIGAALLLKHECADLDQLSAAVDGMPVALLFEENGSGDPIRATLDPAPTDVGQVVEVFNEWDETVTLEVVAADAEPPEAPTFESSWRVWDAGDCGTDDEPGFVMSTYLDTTETTGVVYRIRILADGELAAESAFVHHYDESNRSYDRFGAEFEGAAEICVEVQAEDASGNLSEATIVCMEGPPEGTLPEEAGEEPGGDEPGLDDEAGAKSAGCSLSPAPSGTGILALGLLLGVRRRRHLR